MCFTIATHLPREAITKKFNVDGGALKDYDYRYFSNAFSNPVIPVISQSDPGRISLMQWGLIPSWCKDPDQAYEVRKGTYNARSESLNGKVAFKHTLQSNRCIVIASGFFEWQHYTGQKIPWFISLRNGEPMALAGLYDVWTDPSDGVQLTTFTIITTRANPMMEKIHNTGKRMPVILSDGSEWIGDNVNDEICSRLLIPFPEDKLDAWTVSSGLLKENSDPRNPDAIKKISHYTPGTLF